MKTKPPFTLIDCDREAFEREFVRVGAVGTNEELRAAVERLAHRAELRVVSPDGLSDAAREASED